MAYKHHTYKKRKQPIRRKTTPRKHRGGNENAENKLVPVVSNNNASTIVSDIEEIHNRDSVKNDAYTDADFMDLVNELDDKPTDPFEAGKIIEDVLVSALPRRGDRPSANEDGGRDVTIITKKSPEFQTRIQNAPYLKNIKSKIEPYHFKYLLEVLRDFTYADSHKAYIDASLTDWCYVFVLSQVVDWLQKEIQTIQTTKESKGYAFTTKDSEIILAELQAYIDYFRRNATSWDRLNTQFLEVLFDGIRD